MYQVMKFFCSFALSIAFLINVGTAANAEDRWSMPMKAKVKVGSTTKVGEYGDLIVRLCQAFPAPEFTIENGGKLGKFSSKKIKKPVGKTDTGGGQCAGTETEVINISYTAGMTKGTERVSFNILYRGGYNLRYVYDLTVE